jgi:3',5'-cyclic AMP phosphodiesterase CpdA
MRVRFLSFGRRLDALERRRKLDRAITAARRAGADYFIFSGDLTEYGNDSEYECLAEALCDARLSPDDVTLVPGNHDVYSSADAWKRAMEGPLKMFAAGSAGAPGKIVERQDLSIMPVDCTRHQHVTRSGGELSDAWADALDHRLGDPLLAKKPLVVVQHHPPYRRVPSAWDWIDGLKGSSRLMAGLANASHAFVMHGHLHYASTRTIQGGPARIFGAPAIVEDEETARVRMYEARDGIIEATGVVS